MQRTDAWPEILETLRLNQLSYHTHPGRKKDVGSIEFNRAYCFCGYPASLLRQSVGVRPITRRKSRLKW